MEEEESVLNLKHFDDVCAAIEMEAPKHKKKKNEIPVGAGPRRRKSKKDPNATVVEGFYKMSPHKE